ncbi:dnaJ homolog subfamily C member 27-like isoform X2 [Montipora foliosa]|uniref:dnaJ homolog subfamily C member 27-like isoform X2 n=1 Tax=Montipora foliosa TaxID=591990 RepID=UPI0035F1AD93
MIGLKPSQPLTPCQPITVDLRIAATVLPGCRVSRHVGIKIISVGNAETGKVVHSASRARYARMLHYLKYRFQLMTEVKVNIFDMAGHPVFYKVRNEFYKRLVYDVGNRESFESLDSWLEEIRRDIGNPTDLEGVVFTVCANKVVHGGRPTKERLSRHKKIISC